LKFQVLKIKKRFLAILKLTFWVIFRIIHWLLSSIIALEPLLGLLKLILCLGRWSFR